MNILLKFNKKYFFSFLLLVLLLALGYGCYLFSQRDFWGYRLNFSFHQVATTEYHSYAPNLSFRYPQTFEIDADPEKKYGSGYLVGIKLKTDERTGCDVRTNGPQLDWAKSGQELTEEILSSIEDKTTDFRLLEGQKILVGQKEALKISFSFLDPIGARVRLDQIFVADQGINFLIICGTGEYQYAFFQKDFQLFYDSIVFRSSFDQK